jgi:hypothetical protein
MKEVKKASGRSKLPYQKPMIKVIELTTEEIMGVCKTPGGHGPSGICNFCSNGFGRS